MNAAADLLENFELLPNGIRTALPENERNAEYDQIAGGYDLLVGNPAYNRLVWSCPKRVYREQAIRAFARTIEGPILDFGCGSLVFTAVSFRGREDRLVLLDRSLGMLERGRARLPSGHFLQADAFTPPFAAGSFSGAMSWGMVHVFGTQSDYLARLADMVVPGGAVSLGTLILTKRWLGNSVLGLLHRQGEAAEPQTAETVRSAFARHFDLSAQRQSGSMLFLEGTKRAA